MDIPSLLLATLGASYIGFISSTTFTSRTAGVSTTIVIIILPAAEQLAFFLVARNRNYDIGWFRIGGLVEGLDWHRSTGDADPDDVIAVHLAGLTVSLTPPVLGIITYLAVRSPTGLSVAIATSLMFLSSLAAAPQTKRDFGPYAGPSALAIARLRRQQRSGDL